VKPKKILLVHGEEPAQNWFINRFRDTLSATEIIRPDTHHAVELWYNSIVKKAPDQPFR
jgi:hypothetical protein